MKRRESVAKPRRQASPSSSSHTLTKEKKCRAFSQTSSHRRRTQSLHYRSRLCLSHSVNEKSNQELLAIVLRRQYERVADKGFGEIVQSGQAELGLTKLAYDLLMAGIELGKRAAEPKANYNVKISSTQAATDFCKAHFARLIAEGLQEEFHIVTLDTKHRMINSHLITVGTLDASLVHPREVFRPAIKD